MVVLGVSEGFLLDSEDEVEDDDDEEEDVEEEDESSVVAVSERTPSSMGFKSLHCRWLSASACLGGDPNLHHSNMTK